MQHIIFIPGFYGTRLVQKSDRTIVWISAWQAVLGSKTAARTGFEVPGERELVPSTVLDGVPVIPGIYAADVYGAFLRQLQRKLVTHGLQTQLHLFAYDWRESYFAAVKKLASLITALKNEGAESISIVAHSMGGLITSYYLRYGCQEPEVAVENWEGAKEVDKVVLATVPFKGSMTALHNMKHGAKFGLNTTLIKAHAFATFISVYEMMPAYAPVLLDSSLSPLPHTLFKSELWQRYGWGFLDTSTPVSKQARLKRQTLVTEALLRGQKLYERLHAPLEQSPQLKTELLYTFATSHATIARSVLVDEDASPTLLFHREEFTKYLAGYPYRTLFDDGDETVTAESAQLPTAFKKALANVTEQQSQAVHSQIFNDKDIRKHIFAFLND